MLIRGIEGDRKVGASYLSRQESGVNFRSGPESKGKFQERTGDGMVGERWQAIKAKAQGQKDQLVSKQALIPLVMYSIYYFQA